jgi:zinc and cadmium transporter
MTWAWILAGTFCAGILSVWLAAFLALRVLGSWVPNLLSLAAGALLATAFTHLLPEAFEGEASAHALFGTLLASVVFFFLLEKGELYHHGHDHGDHDHGHGGLAGQGRPHHHHDHHDHGGGPRTGGWALLFGDSVHTFCDGVLIAAAFVADVRLGLAATLAVLAHEVPHHVGDFIVLRHTGYSARRAVIATSGAGAVTVLGGLVGYFAIGGDSPALPYLLVVTASSFIYVALADLIPQLQQRLGARQTLAQILWLGAGIAGMMLVTGALHAH